MFQVEALKKGACLARYMAMKVLLKEGTELRIRISDEDHTTLHLFRSRLNAHKDIEYCNYFSGHPDLDDPEIYIRANKGKDPVKILKSVGSVNSKIYCHSHSLTGQFCRP